MGNLTYTTSEVQSILDGTKSVIYIAANNATANEKAKATYVCDGSNDEVQFALANTAANGGVVKLLVSTFNIASSIVLTSIFEGHSKCTIITVNTAQITLHAPGNLKQIKIIKKGSLN